MSILGEITVSADYKTGFLFPLHGSLIPLLYTLSDFICLCFLLLSLICADKFFLEEFICTVLSIQSLIAVTVAAVLFFNNNTYKDAVMFCDAIVSWPMEKRKKKKVFKCPLLAHCNRNNCSIGQIHSHELKI